jgi:hypothetical protein
MSFEERERERGERDIKKIDLPIRARRSSSFRFQFFFDYLKKMHPLLIANDTSSEQNKIYSHKSAYTSGWGRLFTFINKNNKY